MASVSRGKKNRVRTVIAFLIDAEHRNKARPPQLIDVLQGVHDRSLKLGFEVLELIRPNNAGESQTVGAEMLSAGVQGVIVGPSSTHVARLDLPWQHFASVTVGHSLKSPCLHSIVHDLLDATKAALFDLARLGFKRIGYINYKSHEDVHSHKCLAAYLEWQENQPPKERIPLLRINGFKDLKQAIPWGQRHGLDCVISPLSLQDFFAEFKPVSQSPLFFFQLGMSAEGKGQKDWRGTQMPNYEIGITAVDTLSKLIYNNSRGIPESPFIIEVPGRLDQLET